jgi:hypothetical protein
MGSETYHEPVESLSEETKNMHRAIVSLKEELDAVDWYQQRAEACSDDELRAVLVHNKNEEIEHAMMNLEWIRRHSAVFDENIGTYLRATGPITAIEKKHTPSSDGADNGNPVSTTLGQSPERAVEASALSPTLGIGSLKGAL